MGVCLVALEFVPATNCFAAALMQQLVSSSAGGDEVLRHDTMRPRAAAVWLEWKDREGKSINTMHDYRGDTSSGRSMTAISLT